MEKITKTYSEKIKPTNFIWELSKEAGLVYSTSLKEFWKVYNEEGKWLSKFELQAHMKGKIERSYLHSDSYLSAMQQVHANLESWKEAKKVVPGAKPPHKAKFIQVIRFKKSQIRYKDGYILLALGTDKKGNRKYFKQKWSTELPLPHYASISYDKTKGWNVHFVVEQDNFQEQVQTDKSKVMSIDLGVKRVATIYDGEQTLTISGKKLKALTHYQNKILADKQTKLSKKKKGSKRSVKLKRSWRKKNARLQSIKKDMLHKVSNFIVDYAMEKEVNIIAIGDCSGIHTDTNLGVVNNQQITQNPEQRIKHYVKYKFEQRHGGRVDVVSEAYTSRTCPCCKNIKTTSPKNREYNCEKCDYVYDRDGVGAINIFKDYVNNHPKLKFGLESGSNIGLELLSKKERKNVSFGMSLGRIRLLARPYGIRIESHMLLMKSLDSLRGKSEKSFVSDTTRKGL